MSLFFLNPIDDPAAAGRRCRRRLLPARPRRSLLPPYEVVHEALHLLAERRELAERLLLILLPHLGKRNGRDDVSGARRFYLHGRTHSAGRGERERDPGAHLVEAAEVVELA